MAALSASASMVNPEGKPSSTPPTAGPWDSPNDVRQSRCPKVFPAMKLNYKRNGLFFKQKPPDFPAVDSIY
jgi:hypothetical protein